MTGKVYLVGAGPGDPGLITVKGLELLRKADAVVYDRLIPLSLLGEVRLDAECLDVGKLPHKERTSQAEINTMLVDRAQKGLMVVRLKGGDPFVFGRGGEEGLACYEAGVPFEVVPGVTSAIAVPAYAGVPVTQREITSAFTVFTGHEDPTKHETSIDYEALVVAARLGTLVLMMGVTRLALITEKLLAAGIDPEMPALCVERGTTPQQRVVEATLSTLAAKVIEQGIQPPALTVLGEVVRLRAMGLNWFNL